MAVALFLLGLYALLILQFFRIQIVEHEKWLAKANAQHQLCVEEPARRGRFFSNVEVKKGHPLDPVPFVVDVAHFHLYIDPQSIPEELRNEVAGMLCRTLHQTNAEEIKKLRLQFDKKSRSRRLALWLDAKTREEIQSWWLPFAKSKKLARNALYFVQDYKRSYPFGKLLGQVLHTIREQPDEKTGEDIPTGGLELLLDDYLKGKPGKRLLQRSPRHEMEGGQLLRAPENGADVTLTINHCLQAIAEEEIEKQVLATESKSGWALMMDPYTGEILALAQYPFFEPQRYAHYFNDPKLLEQTKIKAVTDPFEPGSTMKALTIAISLRANDELKRLGKPALFDPEEKVPTMPYLFPGRPRPLKDLKRNHPFLNMYMAIQKSSNVYMGKMVQRIIDRLGADWYRSQLHEVFGFGKKTGIELPGESSGMVPDPKKRHPNGKPEWSVPTPYSLAMGHNILATSVQMLRCFAIIANGGYDVKPTLIKRVEKGERVIYDLSRKLNKRPPKRILDSDTVNYLIKALKFPTKTGGSAPKADIPGYTVGGKTSTSEKIVNGIYSKKDHISTFIGLVPVSKARFVMMVVMDEPAYKFIPGIGSNQLGGNCAAPAFSRIGLRALQYLGVEPDDAEGKRAWMDEVEALKKKYDQWNH